MTRPATLLNRIGFTRTAVARAAVALTLLGSATVPSPEASANPGGAGFVSVARDEINMRSGPGTHHESRWMLARGYPLQTISRRGDWIKVRDFEKDEGWVLRSLTGTTPHVIVTSKTANIRSGPGAGHKRVGRADYGEVLRTLNKRPGWIQVSQEGGTKGWVARQLLWGW